MILIRPFIVIIIEIYDNDGDDNDDDDDSDDDDNGDDSAGDDDNRPFSAGGTT